MSFLKSLFSTLGGSALGGKKENFAPKQSLAPELAMAEAPMEEFEGDAEER